LTGIAVPTILAVLLAATAALRSRETLGTAAAEYDESTRLNLLDSRERM
jgi:hypothetical protein